MKHMKCTAVLLVLALLLTYPVPTARAAESGIVWSAVTLTPAGTDLLVLTDTAAADGLISIEYNPDRLTCTGVLAAEETVAQYAVNAREPGIIKIAWVSGDYSVTGDGKLLFRLSFTGEGTPLLSGQVHDRTGREIPFGVPDSTALQEALDAAEVLEEERYTPISWDFLASALEAGQTVLTDPMASTQELNRAAQRILDALENLVKKPDTEALELAIAEARQLDPDRYPPDSFAPVAEALDSAMALLAREDYSQAEVEDALTLLRQALDGLKLLPQPEETTVPTAPPGENPETGDTARPMLVLILALVSGLGCAAAAFFLLRSRKEGSA